MLTKQQMPDAVLIKEIILDFLLRSGFEFRHDFRSD